MNELIHQLNHGKYSIIDRAVAILWFMSKEGKQESATSKELAKILEASGLAKQNVSRLTVALKSDRRVVNADRGAFRINARLKPVLDDEFLKYTKLRKLPVVESDSVLPVELFSNARTYIQRVVVQINASYDMELFDCCAVMCRRLLETLVIESYENGGYGGKLKGNDDNYMMFSGLLAVIESDNLLNLSRNCLRGLKDFKKLGDLSAHNRKFNARKPDIDRCVDGLRVASEELLHAASMA